jgi:hypothetical protein
MKKQLCPSYNICYFAFRLLVLMTMTDLLMVACDNGGGSGEPRCDVVANANASAFFKVINHLDSGLAWNFSDGSYAFGADMKPNECTVFGLNPGGYSVTFQQCNIGDAACTSYFGPTKDVVFSVNSGETYTVDVSGNFFQ